METMVGENVTILLETGEGYYKIGDSHLTQVEVSQEGIDGSIVTDMSFMGNTKPEFSLDVSLENKSGESCPYCGCQFEEDRCESCYEQKPL